jgi:Isoprenylcysteine carboxyl methyltransferase (ICMT) family
MAMIHASTNFSHRIAHHHRDGHVLVTRGIYRLALSSCHPHSYLQWSSVGLDIRPTLVSFTGQ